MNLQTFDFRQTAVRTFLQEGEVWFVAKDVCDVLDISNPTVAVSRLEDDERSKFNLGRQGEALIVNEPGLYSLILTSRKPEAKAFKRWVTHEVLPAIRQTGSYVAPALADDPIIAMRMKQLELEKRVSRIEQQREEAEEAIAALPRASEPALEASTRTRINQLVKSYAASRHLTFRAVYTWLYREFRDRYHIDLSTRAKNRNQKPLDVAEAEGCLDDLFVLASNILQ
ncbi:MAG: Bro-N domain-containing protein [Calditrichaeota bacterium]|nr:Bro-N domain-containing protein [Calditrichota bacterium]